MSITIKGVPVPHGPTASTTVENGLAPTPHGGLWYQLTSPAQPRGTNDGRPAPLPIVLLHGGPGSPSDYLAPLDALSADRPVLRYDQIGCGRSDSATDETAWTVDAHVDHLDSLTRHLGFDRFHLYGHSWGGMLALAFYEAHPHRAASLTLASPLVDTKRWVADAATLIAELPAEHQAAIAAGTAHAGYAEAEAEFYRRHFCNIEPWPAPIQESDARQNAVAYNAMWGPNEFTQTGNLRDEDRSGVVRELTVPNLWLTGAEDEARPETIRAFAALNSHSSVHVFPGGTHSVHLEQPGPYLAELRAFLRDN